MNRNERVWLATIPGCVLALVFAGVVVASSVTLPNAFVAGTPAVADEVNQNFDAVASAINDNDSRITQNESDLQTLGTNGAVKAAAVISSAGSVNRSFNSLGAAPTVVDGGVGIYRVTFPGFGNMSLRFYSVTIGGPVGSTATGFASAAPYISSLANTVVVRTYDETGVPSDEPFCLVIF